MAKVTLTIEDLEDGDGVKLTLESDPPFDISEDGDKDTDAQTAGVIAMRAIQAAEVIDDDGEIRCDDCRPLYGQCSGCALKETIEEFGIDG